MTREKLEQYKSMKEEITELTYKLKHLGEGDTMIGNDVIMDYRSGYPVPQSVVGSDQVKYWRLRERYENRIQQLQQDCAEVEQFIEDIEDSLTRRIFRMYYMDGLSQSKIAKQVHVAQSVVSEKITNFINSDKNDKKV